MEEIINELPEQVEVVDIQFRPGQKIYFFDPDGMTLVPGDAVVMDTARGAEFGICTGGNHMIPGMLLHVVEPARPVDGAGDGGANLQLLVAGVEDDTLLLPYVGDMGITQHAEVGGLAATLGVKGGTVQRDRPTVFTLLTGQDGGGELL